MQLFDFPYFSKCYSIYLIRELIMPEKLRIIDVIFIDYKKLFIIVIIQ